MLACVTESEDDDLHQCGRCRAMFHRLADYLTHKQHRVCRTYLDSAAQTSPAHLTSDVQTSTDHEEEPVGRSLERPADVSVCSPESICDEHDRFEASDPAQASDITTVPQLNITCDVTGSTSSPDEGGDDVTVTVHESSSQAQSSEDHDMVDVAVPAHHQCPQCDFTTKFRDDFDQHLRRQHGLSCHVCVDCSRAFTNACKLKRHRRQYCTKTQHSALQQAPRYVALDKRKKPQEQVSDDTTDACFHCHLCTSTFTDYDEVHSHVLAAHSDIAKPGICRFCGAWFANPYKLRRHVTSSVHDDVPSDVMTAFKRHIDRTTISYTPEAVKLLRRARAERRQQVAGSGLECVVCGQAFSARSALLRHRKVVHGRRSADLAPTISCQLCGASFDRRRAYLRHRRDEHGKLPVVRVPPATKHCAVCERSFTRADAAARHHATMHTASQQLPDDVLSLDVDEQLLTGSELDIATTTTCFVCAQSSPTRADHVRHLELFHRVWVALPDGPVPPSLFDDMPLIPASVRRIDDHVLAATHSASAEQIVPDVSSSRSVSSRLPCPYCRQEFDTVDALYRHKVDSHRLDALFRCVVTSCRVTFRTLTDYEGHVTVSGHRQTAFICAVCNEHCVDQTSLLSHRGCAHRRPRRPAVPPSTTDTTAGQSGSVLCDECGQTFSGRSVMMRHRAVVHKRDLCRRYTCSQCDRRFVKREHLQRHVVSRHATARPYVCCATGCGRAFKRKDKLQEHYRCHSSDRLYACSLCGRTYRQRVGLRHHERTYHRPKQSSKDPSERRHRCRRCPASFALVCRLNEHLQAVHGRGAGKDVYAHRCDVCGKTFPRRERMRRHAEREHNVAVEWSHRCAVCGKGFAGRRSYDMHTARHHVDGSGRGRLDSGKTSTRLPRRRARVKTATDTASVRDVVTTGRHQSSVAVSCDVTPAAEQTTRQCFNRFFVPSTPSRQRHQQLEQTPQSSSVHGRLSRLNAQSTCLDRLYAPSQCPSSERVNDDVSAHRRLSFESLPYLHHPTRSNADYSAYHHYPTTPHRTQFGFYPSAATGFGYSAAACPAGAPRGCSLFSDDRPAAAALPFGVQSVESVDRRPSEFGSGLPTAFPSVMAGDYSGSSVPVTAPLRPLATQPPAANAYCPVPDPPSVGRWFDSVPALLPPPVDASNLDSVRWPPRPCIDSLTVRPRYPFSVDATSRGHGQQSQSVYSVAGPSWSSVERSCLFNCSSKPESATGAGLVFGSRRSSVDAERGVDTASLYGASQTPHGMLSLLPPW